MGLVGAGALVGCHKAAANRAEQTALSGDSVKQSLAGLERELGELGELGELAAKIRQIDLLRLTVLHQMLAFERLALRDC